MANVVLSDIFTKDGQIVEETTFLIGRWNIQDGTLLTYDDKHVQDTAVLLNTF